MKLTALLSLVLVLTGLPLTALADTNATKESFGSKGSVHFALALAYLGGQGVPKDAAIAARLLRLAADQGNIDAQHMLGLLRKFGQGVSKDSREAVKWFRMAAESGHADAQNNIGMMYIAGQGVPQDFKEAVKWFRLAADQGNANAQNNLAVAFDDGQGVPKSRVIAYALFNAASTAETANDKLVLMSRRSVVNKMSRAELDEGQALTRELVKPGRLLIALDEYIKKAKVR